MTERGGSQTGAGHRDKNAMTTEERAWLAENKAAIDAYNERIAKQGMLIAPIWLKR